MKKQVIFIFGVLLSTLTAMTGDKPAYKIYDSSAGESSYEKMLSAAAKADIVFFGELHDNPISHWLELQITKDLFALKKENLVLGAEMFETDNQVILDEYLKGYIKESSFKEGARLWPNYNTDYKPLVDFAKANKLLFIATNVPRRYASIVASKGWVYLDSMLTLESRKWIAQLPIAYDPELKCYKDMLSMGDPGHGGVNLPKAQALKDATMAEFILKNFRQGKTFLHFNGAYHSNYRQGIVWYLLKSRPGLKIVTISSAEQTALNGLDDESKNLADYIICTPEDMTKTGK
jgi:uncharacterized iron-regulated protein